jgi:hypothetical protein
MYCHQEFTAEEIEDILREAARKRSEGEGHRVPTEAQFLRIADIVFNAVEEGAPAPKIGSATVSWKDP